MSEKQENLPSNLTIADLTAITDQIRAIHQEPRDLNLNKRAWGKLITYLSALPIAVILGAVTWTTQRYEAIDEAPAIHDTTRINRLEIIKHDSIMNSYFQTTESQRAIRNDFLEDIKHIVCADHPNDSLCRR